eukprot:6195307-Pleurochrysis_carterae.AAC.4
MSWCDDFGTTRIVALDRATESSCSGSRRLMSARTSPPKQMQKCRSFNALPAELVRGADAETPKFRMSGEQMQ